MTERSETLLEAVGGIDALRRLSNTFYEGVLADPLLAPVFVHFSRTHIEHVAVWLAEVFGGWGVMGRLEDSPSPEARLAIGAPAEDAARE